MDVRYDKASTFTFCSFFTRIKVFNIRGCAANHAYNTFGKRQTKNKL
jgi:hypothetical protein